MASVDINGARLEYFEDGRGDPLVLVHGSASDYRTWHLQRGEFAEHFRVITYSRRYHWPNAPIEKDADYSMAGHVSDLLELLHFLGTRSVHLVGHSYGAYLCLVLATKEQRLVSSLVLAEPPAITLFVSDPPKPLELLKLLATRPRTAAAIIKFGAKGVAPASKAFRSGDIETGIRTFGDAVFGRGRYRKLPESRKAQVHDNIANVEAELLGSGFMPLDTDQIRNIEIPTLLVNGEESIDLFHRLTDRLEELLPHTERVEIPGASHMMHENNASAYNAAVLAFIRKHRQEA
ncbi:MAG: alpha/beta hydrolase [bacterium]